MSTPPLTRVTARGNPLALTLQRSQAFSMHGSSRPVRPAPSAWVVVSELEPDLRETHGEFAFDCF